MDRVTYESTTRLLVRYTFAALGRPKYSLPQSPRAVFLRDAETLIGELTDTNDFYWPDVAREMALVVYPDWEPGRVSSVFVQVLAGETAEAADATLDSLGVPRLAVAAAPVAVPGAAIEGIGARGGDVVPPFLPQTPPAPPSSGSGAGGQHSATGTGSGTGSRQRRPNKPRSRFLTYVAPDGSGPEPSTDFADNGENREIADAGVRWVRWFEEGQGRVVTVMAQNHPGYDIESRNAETGEIERYIEVKSRGGAWDVDGVGMTVTEFNKARELGDLYWLYVVEWATSDQPELHRIQDPGRKANWFFYDHGWSQAAES